MALWPNSKANQKSGAGTGSARGANGAGAAVTQAEPAQQQSAQPTAAQGLSPAEAQARADASRRSVLAFGQIVSVLMRTQPFNALPLLAIEPLIAPAVLTGQFMVAEAQSHANGVVAPVAAVLWASVSPEIDRRLSENLDKPVQLAPAEWKSGPIPWLVLAAGDQRVVNSILAQLQEKVLGGRPLKMRVKGQDGKEAVGTLTASARQPGAAVS
jgi:hemolysin-activating ACP:hemolysin acyltransferase